MASVFGRSGLSVNSQLHVAFVMLPAKYYKYMFNKVNYRNIVSFFTSDTIKWHFDDVMITSALRSDVAI